MESGGALAIGMRDDRAPIESGGVQLVASSAAQPPRRSRVALRADGAPVEEKGRRKIGGAPPRPCQSRVAMSGKIDEKRRAKSGGTHVATSSTAVPPRQSKAALSSSGAPIKEKTSTKSGSTQAATSSTAPPQIWSIVVMSGIGAPIEEKTRSNSGSKQAAKPSLWRRVATFGASVETAPPLLRSRVASLAELAPNKENRRRTKSHSTQAATSSTAVPPHQSKVAICGSGATIEEKTRSKSCSTQAAASSTAPPLHQSRVPMSVGGVPNKEKRRTKSCSTQAAASSMDPPLHQSRVPMSVSGVSVEEKRRTKSLMPKPPRRSKVVLSANGRPVDGVRRADVIEYYKHCDGSIYRQTDFLSKLYRLHDTNETGLEPMMRSEPSDDCSVNWRACERHANCTMMQIFSLKLAYPPAGDQVKVFGFMAVRDTKDHLRNYIFNRTRDDPFIVEQEDGFIQLSGPKRGIWWYDKQLVEFDMRIKRGENEADDLQIIDGAVWFYDGCSPHARVLTQRIDGDYGSVDISYTRLLLAMEATVQIAVSELDRDIGLLVRAFYVSDLLHQGMQLFDGVIPADAGGADRYELDKYVVAASRHTKLALQLRIRSLDDDGDVWRSCLSPASTHGTDDFSSALSFATIDVKISWSTLD